MDIHLYIHLVSEDLQLIVDQLTALQLIEDQKTDILKTAVQTAMEDNSV